MLFLMPGQEMPSHPHERFEVVLVPHKGRGVMIVDSEKNGEKEVHLMPETLYYEPAGRTFCIRNTGDDPLHVLITLIRIEPVAELVAGSAPPPEGEAGENDRRATAS